MDRQPTAASLDVGGQKNWFYGCIGEKHWGPHTPYQSVASITKDKDSTLPMLYDNIDSYWLGSSSFHIHYKWDQQASPYKLPLQYLFEDNGNHIPNYDSWQIPIQVPKWHLTLKLTVPSGESQMIILL